MNHRAAYVGIVSAILLCIGLFALRFPVYLDQYDQWGWQIGCGTGFSSDLTQAAAAVGDEDYVNQCENALIVRRVCGPFFSSFSVPLCFSRYWV